MSLPFVRIVGTRAVWIWKVVARMPGRCAIATLRFYQRGISPLLGQNCKFQPTCSEYMIGAIRKYGVVRGTILGTKRVLRCHPWQRGGYDPP